MWAGSQVERWEQDCQWDLVEALHFTFHEKGFCPLAVLIYSRLPRRDSRWGWTFPGWPAFELGGPQTLLELDYNTHREPSYLRTSPESGSITAQGKNQERGMFGETGGQGWYGAVGGFGQRRVEFRHPLILLSPNLGGPVSWCSLLYEYPVLTGLAGEVITVARSSSSKFRASPGKARQIRTLGSSQWILLAEL